MIIITTEVIKLKTSPPQPDLFFSTQDPEDLRLGDLFPLSQNISVLGAVDSSLFSKKKKILLLGYPDDEGIRLNRGRPGAASAPQEIRRVLYKLTPPHHYPDLNDIYFQDLGDLNTNDLKLPERHQLAQELIHQILIQGCQSISLGGGHDYGFPDSAAFVEYILKTKSSQKPLVINFDAHLDVRPLNRGLTSGTPFYRLLNQYQSKIDFLSIGPQPQCNSSTHWNWCLQHGGKILSWDEISQFSHPQIGFQQWLDPLTSLHPPTFISVDIDCFSSSFAMGCSQSWPTGFTPEIFFPFFNHILHTCNVHSLGIYEVSPTLDWDQRTSKLAALIIYSFIFSQSQNSNYLTKKP